MNMFFIFSFQNCLEQVRQAMAAFLNFVVDDARSISGIIVLGSGCAAFDLAAGAMIVVGDSAEGQPFVGLLSDGKDFIGAVGGEGGRIDRWLGGPARRQTFLQ